MSGCPHGMPSPGSCIDCMEEGNLPPAPRAPVRDLAVEGRAFSARFPGECAAGCGHPIAVDDDIRRLVDHTGYVHDRCVS